MKPGVESGPPACKRTLHSFGPSPQPWGVCPICLGATDTLGQAEGQVSGCLHHMKPSMADNHPSSRVWTSEVLASFSLNLRRVDAYCAYNGAKVFVTQGGFVFVWCL